METTFDFIRITPGVQAFFPVTTRSIYFDDVIIPGNRRLYPDRKVIIDAGTGNGLSIVPDSHLAVAHCDAFELGKQIFKMLFDRTPVVYRENCNSRKTDYSVDLINEDCRFILTKDGYRFTSSENADFLFSNGLKEHQQMPVALVKDNFRDEYYPFVRVSNYLRTGTSFEIEVGYYRWKCQNGLMMGKKTKLRFRQSYRCPGFDYIAVKAENYFRINRNVLGDDARRIWNMLTIPVKTEHMPLIAVEIFKEELLRMKRNERIALMEKLRPLAEKYALEIGENASAAVNTATDFSKLLVGYRVSPSYIQELTGRWVGHADRRGYNMNEKLNSLKLLEQRLLHEDAEPEKEEVMEEDEI